MKSGNNFIGFSSFFFLLIFSLIISNSCTRGEPKIVYGFLNLVLYQGESGPVEHFSLFILCEDEDGIENLDHLFLYHDREQLRWQIKSDEWQRYTFDGNEWIGTRSIAVFEGSLPHGVYRVVLVNKGGESAQRNFTYDGNVSFPFPALYISNGEYTINSLWPVNRLVCYDSSGNYSTTVTLNSRTGKISELRLPSSAVTAALWAEDESNFCSAFTDVAPLY
ncbi:MAG: hypothetical protein FWC22_00360 [Treponema sp.]|nr:hypothetical protein [Treponema sp.]